MTCYKTLRLIGHNPSILKKDIYIFKKKRKNIKKAHFETFHHYLTIHNKVTLRLYRGLITYFLFVSRVFTNRWTLVTQTSKWSILYGELWGTICKLVEWQVLLWPMNFSIHRSLVLFVYWLHKNTSQTKSRPLLCWFVHTTTATVSNM